MADLENFNNKDLISIIVPVYNCEKYLSKCIESILQQTYTDFELILINDGSQDLSLSICEKYQEVDNRIIVLSHDNCGVAKTRQIGVEVSKGNYITFIDSDDYIEKDFLERLLSELCKANSDIVCCNVYYRGDISEDITSNKAIENYGEFINDYFEGKFYAYCIWGKLYKRHLLEDVRFRDLRYGEDTYYILEVVQCANKIIILDYVGYHYLDNPNGAVRNVVGISLIKDHLVVFQYVLDICVKNYSAFVLKACKLVSHGLLSLISCASVSKKEEQKEAYLIAKEIISKNKDIFREHKINLFFIKLYLIFPKMVLLAYKIYKKAKLFLRKK